MKKLPPFSFFWWMRAAEDMRHSVGEGAHPSSFLWRQSATLTMEAPCESLWKAQKWELFKGWAQMIQAITMKGIPSIPFCLRLWFRMEAASFALARSRCFRRKDKSVSQI